MTTGEDRLPVKRKYRGCQDGKLSIRLMISSNELQKLSDASTAIIGRILPLRMTESFLGREDIGLANRLMGELPGILNWAVAGCLDWQRNGLGEPDEVREATAAYQGEQDLLGAFIAERCLTGDSAFTCKASDLYAAFCRWCEASGEAKGREVPSPRNLGEALTAKGFERYTNNGPVTVA